MGRDQGKGLLITSVLLVALLIACIGAAHIATAQKAQYSYPSPSGRFILQSVLLAPWSDLAYIRVIDTQATGSTFRTPLYGQQYTDMRLHEDEKTVGTYWIDFDSWLNIFISNTPYRIIEN